MKRKFQYNNEILNFFKNNRGDIILHTKPSRGAVQPVILAGDSDAYNDLDELLHTKQKIVTMSPLIDVRHACSILDDKTQNALDVFYNNAQTIGFRTRRQDHTASGPIVFIKWDKARTVFDHCQDLALQSLYGVKSP